MSAENESRGLFLGAAFGVGAGLLLLAPAAVFYVKRQERGLAGGWSPAPLVVAARTLSAGMTLTREDLTSRMVPTDLLGGAIPSGGEAGLVGRTLRVPVRMGDVVFRGAVEELSASQECWVALNAAINDASASKAPAAKALMKVATSKLGPSPFPAPGPVSVRDMESGEDGGE